MHPKVCKMPGNVELWHLAGYTASNMCCSVSHYKIPRVVYPRGILTTVRHPPRGVSTNSISLTLGIIHTHIHIYIYIIIIYTYPDIHRNTLFKWWSKNVFQAMLMLSVGCFLSWFNTCVHKVFFLTTMVPSHRQTNSSISIIIIY